MIIGCLFNPSSIGIILDVINGAIIDRFVVHLGRLYLYTPSGFIAAFMRVPRCTRADYTEYMDVIQDIHDQFVTQYVSWMQLDRLPIAVNPVSYGHCMHADSDYLYLDLPEYICIYSFRNKAFVFDNSAYLDIIGQLYRLKPSEITEEGMEIIADYRKRRHDDKIQHHRYADKYADVSIMCQE